MDTTKKYREIERLAEQKNNLENSFGNGSFHDGIIRQQIEQIDRRLDGLRAVAS